MSARAQSKQQLHIQGQGSRVIFKLVVYPRKVTQHLEVKKKKKTSLQVEVIPIKCTSLQVDFKIN